MTTFLTVVHVIACLLLILLILIQKDKGGGLAGAFGGMGGSGSPFGIRTADVLTKGTVLLFAVVVLTALLAIWSHRSGASPATQVPPASQGTPQ